MFLLWFALPVFDIWYFYSCVCVCVGVGVVWLSLIFFLCVNVHHGEFCGLKFTGTFSPYFVFVYICQCMVCVLILFSFVWEHLWHKVYLMGIKWDFDLLVFVVWMVYNYLCFPRVCACARAHTHTHTHTHIYIYIYIYIYMHTHTLIYVYLCIFIYVFVCVWFMFYLKFFLDVLSNTNKSIWY